MTPSTKKSVAILAVLVMQNWIARAEDGLAPTSAKTVKPSRAELRDKQLDVSLESRDIERILGKLKRASDLSKQRISEASKVAESVSALLDARDTKSAQAEAQQTVVMFKEIIKQLEILLKEETPQRIAEARQLAQELAMAEKEFAEKFEGMLNPIKMGSGTSKIDPKSQLNPPADSDKKPETNQSSAKGDGSGDGERQRDRENGSDGKNTDDKKNGGDDPKENGKSNAKVKRDEKSASDPRTGSSRDEENDKTPDGAGKNSAVSGNGREKSDPTPEQLRQMVAEHAEKLAETGKTLQDVLNEIVKSTDPDEKDAVAAIQAVLREIDINKVADRMGRVPNMIRSKNDVDAKLASLDAAERLEILAGRLDGAYRSIVAPQAENLRKLEQLLADLSDQKDKLETPLQLAAWHRSMLDLLDKLDKLGLNPAARTEFEQEMKKAGIGTDLNRGGQNVNANFADGHYVFPANINHAMVHLQEAVQERIQSLILGDLGNNSDDMAPPKYQELVERYYEVLSRKPAEKSGARKR